MRLHEGRVSCSSCFTAAVIGCAIVDQATYCSRFDVMSKNAEALPHWDAHVCLSGTLTSVMNNHMPNVDADFHMLKDALQMRRHREAMGLIAMSERCRSLEYFANNW